MKEHPLRTIIFLASFLQISFAFICSDLNAKQCNQLKPDGCIWSGTVCSGSYSPSCIPPSCYYIESNSQSTGTPDGTPGKPLKTLSDGFTQISGKDGFLIIVNIMENATVAVNKASTISSNITVKPLFEDMSCTIDFTSFTTLFGTALTIKNSLKVIGTKFHLKYQNLVGGVLVFSVNSGAGGLYFENVEVKDTSNIAESMITLVRVTNSTFAMINSKFTDASILFLGNTNSTTIWKNVSANGQNSLRTALTSAKTVIMKNCLFTGGLGGGFLTATSVSEVLLKNCTFKDLTYSPIFLINAVVRLTVEDCIFDNIFGTSIQLFKFQKGSSRYGAPSAIKNTSFTNIAVQISLFTLEGSTVNLSLMNVTMKNITQQAHIQVSSAYIASQLSIPRGVCCSSVRRAQLYVESSNFSNILSHCFGLQDTQFRMKSSIFDNSQISTPEALIAREDISSLDDNSGVSWINIEGPSFFYGDIYKILIHDSKFIQNGLLPKSGGAIRFKGVLPSQITITGSEFIGNRAYYGGAISSENSIVSFIKLENNLFADNFAYHGGAIYKRDRRSLEALSDVSLSVEESQFIGNNAAKNGGALYLSWDSVWISKTEFISNFATNGGALYHIGLDEANNEKYGGLRNVSFIENSASNVGGAMKLFFEYSQLKTDATIFENNFDSKQQAINQGRPSYYLLSFYDLLVLGEIARQESLEDLVKNPRLTRLNFTVNTSESLAIWAEIKHKSGNELAQILHFQLFDSENRVADYIDDEQITVEMVTFQNDISNYPASLVSSPLKFKVSNGQFFVKSAIKMHGEPKTTATLQFSNVQGFSDFIQDSGMQKSFDLQVRFEDCEEGEIFESHTRFCLACVAGSYSFGDPYKTRHCNQCPSEIGCYGGNKVGPKSGYWMGSPSSLNAIRCPYPSACLGGYVDNEYFPNGKCLFPHQGNLCNQCAPKFAKFGSLTKCEDCKDNVEYYLKFLLFLVLQVAVVLGLFKLNEKQDKTSTFFANIMKIFINFTQINSITISYNLEWPSLSKNFIQAINSFIPVNHDGFAIDCFISLALPNNQNLIFVKLIMTSFQPFIIWGLSILAYLLTLLCSSQRGFLGKKLKEALGRLFIISAFLVQPNIILTCLELFSCQNLNSFEDPKYYLTSNSNLRCWTGSHLIWSFGLALPLFLIWAVLLPAILYCKTRNYSSKLPCWQPFLYQGLEKKRFYWEFIMLFFKTLVIILFTILTIIQTEIQVLSTFFVCLSLTVLFLRLRPYADQRLQTLGFFSLVTLTLISYVGFFSFTDNWMDIQRILGSVLLIVANCGLFTLSAFYIMRDYLKTKRLEVPAPVEAQQPQTEARELYKTKEEQQKQVTDAANEKTVVRSDNNEPRNEDVEVCAELNQETDIRKIYQAKKESIDNFSIMQSSGSGLLSPLQSTRMSSSRLLSPTLPKQIILSPTTPKENINGKGDFLQKSIKQKKINLTRINMKQFVVNELELKNTETEKAVTETTRTEMTSARTQEDVESANLLLNTLKFDKINTKNNEEDVVSANV